MAKFNDVTRILVIKTNRAGAGESSNRYRNTNFKHLSETATPAQVLEAAKALASLMDEDVAGMYINDKNEVALDLEDVQD